MAYTYEYDTAYHGPAMPVVEIEVGAAAADQKGRLYQKGRFLLEIQETHRDLRLYEQVHHFL